jgi:hypothetical protein
MPQDQIEWLLKTGSIYGLGFAALAVGVSMAFYFLWRIGLGVANFVDDVRTKWFPNVVTGHLAFLSRTQESNDATLAAVEKMTAGHAVSSDSHEKTHRALEYIARAQAEGDVCEDARAFLVEAVKILK